MQTHQIKVSQLSAHYLGTSVLQAVSFEVTQGNLIGIVGPNGAGKSTLVKAMLGIIKSTGDVTINGVRLHALKAKWGRRISSEANKAAKVAYIKQGGDYDLTFPILVKDVVMLGLYQAIGPFRRPNKKHRQLVKDALESVEMSTYSNHQISALSGGQWQRVLIARMLVQDADVLFLDEPFTGVDVDSEKQIMTILRGLKEKGKTVFMIYHDLDKVADYFDEVLLVNKGIVAYGPTRNVFTEENLKRTYMRGDG